MGLRGLLFGKTRNVGNINLLTPQQSSFLSQLLSSTQGQAQEAASNMLSSYTPEQYQNFYQQSFINPAQQLLQRTLIPQIKENYLGMDESASGALHRALAQSATDVATGLGQGMLGQYNQHQQNQLGMLKTLAALLGHKGIEPHMQQSAGILSPLLSVLSGPLGGLFGLMGGR